MLKSNEGVLSEGGPFRVNHVDVTSPTAVWIQFANRSGNPEAPVASLSDILTVA